MDIHDLLARTDPDGHAYPRPMLAREHWESLNGVWDFAIDRDATWTTPSAVQWDRQIRVPFSPETERSGIGDTGFYMACWYRRTVPAQPLGPRDRLILHFGAVDYRATVWVNGQVAAHHEGGYTPFQIDITRLLLADRPIVLVVRAEDDPHDLAKPRGKQDWQLHPHAIWYPRTTGIWQTVWLERVPPTRIGTLRWTSNLARWEIGLIARLRGDPEPRLRMRVRLRGRGETLAEDEYLVTAGEVHRRVVLSDPGIDDFRNEYLWSPGSPTLIAAEIELWSDEGLLDRVHSYTALRAFGIEGDRFVLNGRPFLMRLVLDQGYWPGTGLTAPNDAAFRYDVEITKEMGFNGVRKHQKIENPRYLYWADRLGLLVWEEMPSAYRYTTQSIRRVTEQWFDVIQRDSSHPCIAAWVPFNESWGVPNLPDSPAERHFVQAVYHLTKTLDTTRPVIGNDGWESVATDIIGIHDYDSDPARIARRYETGELRPRLFRHERPGGRKLVLEGHQQPELPIVLSEFGGIALSSDPSQTWGYSRAVDAQTFATRYGNLLKTVRSLEMLCGFCYTQFADTFQEANGLLYADRTPKFPLHEIALATTGGHHR